MPATQRRCKRFCECRLRQTVADLLRRDAELDIGTPEHRWVRRLLGGIRNSYECGESLMAELDPLGVGIDFYEHDHPEPPTEPATI
jgi:hypothetical protein